MTDSIKKTKIIHQSKSKGKSKGKSRKIFLYKLFKQPGDPKKPVNLFMGSSSIGVFNLFTKNTNNLIYKFKGATAKGLLTNDNGKDIMKVLEEYKKRKIRINCIIMHFGEVDLNFSYFFKSLQNIQAKAKDDWYIPYRDFCDSILTPYKEFLNKVTRVSNCKRLIIKGIYPNPLVDGNKKLQLVNYAIMQPEEADKLIPSTLTKKFEEMMRKYYNTELRNGCHGKMHDKMYDKMYYYDLDKELLDKDGMKVTDEYCDLSKVNIHLRWEPLVKLHLKKLMQMGLCGITKNDIVDKEKLKADEKEYLEYKKQKLQAKGILEKDILEG
jgi:hypothetical protein